MKLADTRSPTPWAVRTSDGASFELLPQIADASGPVLYWLAAMGVPARHYLPLTEALADRGITTVLHEWRGIGSSSERARRGTSWTYRELLNVDVAAGVASVITQLGDRHVLIGGHSLGGQLACLYAALHPDAFAGVAMIASGAPYWRQYRHGQLLRAALGAAPALAGLVGYLPGRRIGFGGNEARGVVDDWSYTGRTGSYCVASVSANLDAALGQLQKPVLGVRLHDDWMVPARSLEWLLQKMPGCTAQRIVLDRAALGGVPADHFAWMKQSQVPAAALAQWIHAQLDCKPRDQSTPVCT